MLSWRRGGFAAPRPAGGEREGFLNPLRRRRQFQAFVKAHHDRRTEIFLNLDRDFRSQFHPCAIQVATEDHALLFTLEQLCE